MLHALEKDRRRLADLATQIEDLERSLSALKEEEFEVQKRLNAYKYPILTLPNEIIGEIFDHFLPVYPDPPPLLGIYSPTLLTRICRKWRTIALATHALWRSVKLISNSDMPIEQQERISEVWLHRSGSCPLSVNIANTSQLMPGPFTPGTFTGIVAHRARWEHLHFEDSVYALQAINGPIPLLRHLTLSVQIVPNLMDELTFHGMPLLRTLVLRWTVFRTLPWEQLTSLTLSPVAVRHCVAILPQITHLVHCELVLCADNLHLYPLPDIVIVFPQLQSLTLRILGAEDEDLKFLDILVVPALRRLKLPEGHLGSNPLVGLESFISKSGCRLQEACITHGKPDNQASYPPAFASIPNFLFNNHYDGLTDDEDSGSEWSASESSDAESD